MPPIGVAPWPGRWTDRGHGPLLPVVVFHQMEGAVVSHCETATVSLSDFVTNYSLLLAGQELCNSHAIMGLSYF